MNNKVALITGGTSGIGLAAAKLFALRGAKVVVVGRRPLLGKEAVEQIAGQASYICADLSHADSPIKIVQETVKTYGALDFAFNCAATRGELSPFADASLNNYEEVFDLNLRAVWLCMQQQIKVMLHAGHGVIVNCSSIASKVTFPGASLYSASKAAVNALTRSAALEYAKDNIRINAICPATILSLGVKEYFENNLIAKEKFIEKHPIGRFGEPEEVANLAVWLCSDEASFMAGATINIDGALTTQ